MAEESFVLTRTDDLHRPKVEAFYLIRDWFYKFPTEEELVQQFIFADDPDWRTECTKALRHYGKQDFAVTLNLMLGPVTTWLMNKTRMSLAIGILVLLRYKFKKTMRSTYSILF